MRFKQWIDENHRWLELVLTTIAIGVATWLLCATLEQVKISQDQVKIGQDQVAASREQNNISREIGQKEVRAYVAITDMKFLTESIAIGQIPRVFFQIKNTGKSPALNVGVNIALELRESLLPSAMDSITNKTPFSRFAIGGESGLGWQEHRDLERTFTAEDMNAFRTGEKSLILYGKIFYEDVFGGKDTTEIHVVRNNSGNFSIIAPTFNRIK